jgi:hypothetical protein
MDGGDQMWAIEWSRDGVVRGLMLRLYESEAKAAFTICELARAELRRESECSE